MTNGFSASVIILSWNGERFLRPCLQAVLAQTDDAIEVFVVDNASADQSAAIAQSFAPRVRLIQNETNLGFAGGNNVGIKAAHGEIVILLNQDTVVQPGWLTAILETFTDPTIGIVGCKALYPDGKTIQHAGAQVKPGNALTEHIGLGQLDQGQYDQLADMDYVTGAAFAIHQRVLANLGGLDEAFYPAFYEEIDYCYRTRRTGFRVVYQPRAAFWHYETASLPAKSYTRASALHRNRLRFVLRHWTAEELDAFSIAERQLMGLARWGDDETVARARAYFEAMLNFSKIMAERSKDPCLGGRLTKTRQLQLFDDLDILRQETLQYLSAIVIDSLEWGHKDKRLVLTFDLSPLHALVRDMQALPPLYESAMPVSSLPVFGPLITHIRSAWLASMVRPYMLPMMQAQWDYNARVKQTLGELIRQITIQTVATQEIVFGQMKALRQQVEAYGAGDADVFETLRQGAAGYATNEDER